ncbi:MAG: TATA box-binding protein, partial [Thermoprotei archaeon]
MSHVKPEKVARFERIGMHSHIKGLGLRNGKALPIADGLVGQIKAREAAGIVVEMIKSGKMAGKAILFAGPPGTGKTALAVAIAKELGEDTPFMVLSGSEIYSAEMKKTEVLMQAMRKAIGVRIREFRKVYEGVVKDLNIKFDRHPYNPYQQIPVGAKITLKTTSEERTFTVDETVTMELLSKGVNVGDVIWIDAESGKVTKVGISAEAKESIDIGVARKVPIPSGPIAKEKEFVYTVTLHDLDIMHARRGSIFSLLFGGREEREISPETRATVDEMVKKMVDEGTAEIIPGVLFIDDVHMLDIEAYSFLSRAMEGELAPIIILASNRGFAKIRGTDMVAPHGMPIDLLDRLLIIETKPYDENEIREI